MNKILLLAAIAFSALSVKADLNGDGYYRVQNAITKRYAYLMDNKGSVNVQATTADVMALHLYSGFLRVSSDPASIFYINSVGGSKYDISGQGTSIHGLLDVYLSVIKGKAVDGDQTYYAYASNSGMTKYLGDLRTDSDDERGYPSVDAKGDNRLWYIHELNEGSDDKYFGIAPTLTANGKYYYPLYAAFPYSAASDATKFYVVSKVDASREVVVIKEVEGIVPASVPVIVECANPLATDNRLKIGQAGSPASIASNSLRGVYFDNDMTTHYNRTKYDKNSMRSLEVVDGKLMFVVGDYEFVPRNQAYLTLQNAEQQNVGSYEVITESEYEKLISAVSEIPEDHIVDVYHLDGSLVKSAMPKSEVHSLPAGVYLLRSGDSTEKVIVN